MRICVFVRVVYYDVPAVALHACVVCVCLRVFVCVCVCVCVCARARTRVRFHDDVPVAALCAYM
jgi:hypothetical protein